MATTFGKRLRAAREKTGKTQQDVADLFSLKRESVAQWESDQALPTADKLLRLAAALKTNVDYLLSGKVRSNHAGTNVASGPDIYRQAPLLTWVRAAQFEEPLVHPQMDDVVTWYPMPKRGGAKTYCLRVEGDSMTAPYGKTYPEGCIIFVDPDQRVPANGARVIAKLVGSEEVCFKQFVVEGKRMYLKPLNPQHPPIFDSFRVIGTVIGKWEDD